MARTTDKDRVRSWQGKVTASTKLYRKWEERFRCQALEDYYEGKQWDEQHEEIGREHYVINMIFPSIEIKIPSLFFYHPQVRIRPRPTRQDDKQSLAEERARLQQDTVNTLIADRRVGFKQEVSLALRESFFRFAVVEVGYSGDYIDNPLLKKPELTDEEKQYARAERIPNPDNPQPETIYVKRIPAKSFRVGINARNILSRNDWVGYSEEQFPADLKANPNYRNTSGLKATGRLKGDYEERSVDSEDVDVDGNVANRDTVRIWKIWDLRSRKRYVFAEGGDKFLLEEPFDYLPFTVYKQYERLDNWLPLPPVYNWLHPQNELNETREQQRVHRRRFNRQFTWLDSRIDEEEVRKLMDGGDGVFAKANAEDPIQPVPGAPMDSSVVRSLPDSKADFLEISGVSDEARGQAEPTTTATQANIVDVRSRIRESYQRNAVADWLGDIARLMLRTIRDRMVLPVWIQINTDPTGADAAQEAMKTAILWKQINAAKELGDIEEDITVDMTSLTPMVEEQERQQWTQVMALLTNPSLVAVLSSSEVLLRKTLGYFNVRSEREIGEIKKAMQQIMTMLAAAAAQKAGVSTGSGPAGRLGPGQTPDNAGIAEQLQAQLPM